MIEEIREYWNRRPCNIKHGQSPVGTPEWSQEVTARKYYVESHIPGFAQFERWKEKRVLEIGCGIGTDTVEFCKAGAYVWAMDLSERSIELAKLRCSQASFSVGNAEERLPSVQFDLIYAFGVLHHTPKPWAVLANAHRQLKWNGGELRIMLYAKWSLKHLLGQQPEAQAGCPLARVYSKREARQLLERDGFEVVSIEKTHIFPWRVKDYIQHRYVKVWLWRWMPMKLFHWLESKLGWHLLIVGRKV